MAKHDYDMGLVRERALELALKWGQDMGYDSGNILIAAKQFEDYLAGEEASPSVG